MDPLTKKLIELMPEFADICAAEDCMHCELKLPVRPITLADVLRAFQGNKKAPIGVDMNGYFLDCNDACTEYWSIEECQWNLSEDLSGQSSETKAFLAKILL